MKFGQDFKAALQREGFPDHWVEHAIPYSQLKKCLKKIIKELEDLGLDPETIHELISAESHDGLELKYNLEPDKKVKTVKPRLMIYVHVQDGAPVNATLTGPSKKLVNRLLSQQNGTIVHTSPDSPQEECGATALALSQPDGHSSQEHPDSSQVIEVPLHFDAKFFEMLQKDVNGLEVVQKQEEKTLSSEIDELQNIVAVVSRPSKYSKTDLNRWREIFQVYLDAQIFFSNQESGAGARKSSQALKQLQWFQSEMKRREIDHKFKCPNSHGAYNRFLEINASILKNLQFQEINKLAITKILKKFDKRTSFGVSKVYPKTINSTRIISGSIAKGLCAAISNQIVSLVPQIDDYLCPICCSITWRAVRVGCNHVFCISCVIKLQNDPKHKGQCPMCRADTIKSANTDNLDRKLEKFLITNFPKEVRAKSNEDDMEAGIAAYGEGYHRSKCTIM